MGRGAVRLPARPRPPDPEGRLFAPAPEVEHWARVHLIEEDGAIWNPEHAHLGEAVIAVQWTWIEYRRQGQPKAGTAETVSPRPGLPAWPRERLIEQVRLLAGIGPDDQDPDFLITLYAPYVESCPDADFCALIDHELCHCGVAVGEDGAPKFSRDGRPRWAIVGHDIEEFVSIVRRYGPGAAAGATAELVAAAGRKPEIAAARIASACGTCRAVA